MESKSNTALADVGGDQVEIDLGTNLALSQRASRQEPSCCLRGLRDCGYCCQATCCLPQLRLSYESCNEENRVKSIFKHYPKNLTKWFFWALTSWLIALYIYYAIESFLHLPQKCQNKHVQIQYIKYINKTDQYWIYDYLIVDKLVDKQACQVHFPSQTAQIHIIGFDTNIYTVNQSIEMSTCGDGSCSFDLDRPNVYTEAVNQVILRIGILFVLGLLPLMSCCFCSLRAQYKIHYWKKGHPSAVGTCL